MLTITTSDTEYYNDETSEFVFVKGRIIDLEHSLVSLSKWESKWGKPFLSKELKTDKESKDYIRCMCIDRNVSDDVINALFNEYAEVIKQYISAKMTATTFSDIHRPVGTSEIITAELIYYWMISFNIPFECEKWHLNRLLTLVRVCSIKNTPPQKVPRSAILSRNAALNAARRKKLNTKG